MIVLLISAILSVRYIIESSLRVGFRKNKTV